MITNFHDLYQKYAQDVYRFAYWLCGNAQDAEDITSETFVRALTVPDRIEAETVKGYLLTIAKNLAYKKNKRDQRFAPLDSEIISSLDGPAKSAETSASLQYTMRFIQTLHPTDRAALLMRLQDELSYEEIASVLNISLAATKVKIHRSRLKLAEFMHKQEEHQL
jgi:RNA polymerase sigma-70 factor (ECF subfamily)